MGRGGDIVKYPEFRGAGFAPEIPVGEPVR
jgi:hypothetical protein